MKLSLARQRSPLELLEIARIGGEAETVRRVMGETLRREEEWLLAQFVAIKPDLAGYCRLAGQAQMITKLRKSLQIQSAEGQEAAGEIQKGGR
jgi:hypothetical protein